MARSTGNIPLKEARVAAGYGSQQALAEAMIMSAKKRGIAGYSVGVRQIRRWESAEPGWPQPQARMLLEALLGQDAVSLGFVPPWGAVRAHPQAAPPPYTGAGAPAPLAALPLGASRDYVTLTATYRHMYWTVPPAQLYPAVAEHARLGTLLLSQVTGAPRPALAAALAETHLLSARVEFFDLRRSAAADTLVRALQAAGEADDYLLGAAILAHAAIIPAWTGQRTLARERLRAARAYARRGPASADLLAWLAAVEAETETRCGQPRAALQHIARAEKELAADNGHPNPPWLDWFNVVRLAAFKGNVELRVGHLPQARRTLLDALEHLPAEADKQRTIILGDLAATEAAAERPEQACTYAMEALEQLECTWYATGMERVQEARQALEPWATSQAVRELDDRLYGWGATLNALLG